MSVDVLTADDLQLAIASLTARPTTRPTYLGHPAHVGHLLAHRGGQPGCPRCWRAWGRMQVVGKAR